MEDVLMGIFVITLALSCTILPCILLRKLYKNKQQKKENEFISYLKKNQFDFKNDDHLKLVRKVSIDKYFESLKILTTMFVFNTLALIRMHRTYMVCLWTVLLILVLYKWFKKFDETELKSFTCPKCHGKVCWFEKEKVASNTSENGDKNKKGKIFYCEKCQYSEKSGGVISKNLI